jgi:hypothetical protein
MTFARAGALLLLLTIPLVAGSGCGSCGLDLTRSGCWNSYDYHAELRNVDNAGKKPIWISTVGVWVDVPGDTGGVSKEIRYNESREITVGELNSVTGQYGQYDSPHVYTFIAHRDGVNLYRVECQEPVEHRGHNAEVVWDGHTMQCLGGWDTRYGHGY